MKTSIILSKKAGLTFIMFCFTALLLVTSCSKDNPEPEVVPTGDFKAQFVNAYSGSPAQEFYVNNVRLGTQTVTYGQTSGYITSNTSNYSFTFKDAGTTVVNGGIQGSVEIGGSYTFFYYRSSIGTKSVIGFRDDVTAPATGKAKVRFVHLNSFIANTFPLTVTVQGSTTALVSDLIADYYTNFYEVDATSKFTISGLAAPVSFSGISLASGKVYTIWLGGSTSTELTANAILLN